MEDEHADFTIETRGIGGRVVVNGEDVTGMVSRVVVEADAVNPTRVGIEAKPGMSGKITGKGIVQVLPGEAQAEVVQQWLGAIDPQTLMREVLERSSLEGLGGADPVSVALAVLQEWARGAPD